LIFRLDHISKVARWLTPTNFSAQQIDIISKRQEGTGLWLLNSKEYKMWVDGREQTLFCAGIPGAGKTMMSSIVVDDLRNIFGDNDGIGIACLFCSYKSRVERVSVDLLASLLKQLVQERPVLPDVVNALHESHARRNTRPSFDDLSRVLRFVVDSYSRVFFVIDALDECSNVDRTRERLLREIFELQNQKRISVFATSRFSSEIEKYFEGSTSLEIRARDEDVQRYLDERIPQLLRSAISKYSDLQDTVRREVLKAADGMYVHPLSTCDTDPVNC
jgi:Cdc6-like AAA superfamily ATPase